jgi:hypothetical protein
MNTKSKADVSNSPIPMAFRTEFNHFENISATQAWSLFFTASHEDTYLGKSLGVGRFWNILLTSIIVASILNILIFKSSWL